MYFAGDSFLWASNDLGSTAGEKYTHTKVEGPKCTPQGGSS